MQFRVAPGSAWPDPSALPQVRSDRCPQIAEASAIRTRRLTLEELDNLVGEPMVHLLDGKHWHEPVSEKAGARHNRDLGVLNLTDDTHPIHLHLVRFQILDRRLLDVAL
jgi:spore coat protein A